MTTWITICDTCKREGWEAGEKGNPTDGEIFAAFVEKAAAGQVKTRRFSCLMGCARACNITIQAPGKISYSLGCFAPVPYRLWPEAIKGHFVSRHPPLPES